MFWKNKGGKEPQSDKLWWLGFRQIKVRTTEGVIKHPGNAVLIGPYTTYGEAQQERLRGLAKEWDAAYSHPFTAPDKGDAAMHVESLTPTS